MPNPNTETNETNKPNLTPGGPGEDQNLSGESTEVNPGETGNTTEVDLDPGKTNTYEGDDGAPSKQ